MSFFKFTFLVSLPLILCSYGSLSDPQKHAPTKKAVYVDAAVCLSCHTQVAEQWKASHHALSMQKATASTVLGDFNNTTFNSNTTTRFFKQDNQFMVNTSGADGKIQTFKISYTFGIHPLQQYLVDFPDGRKQVLNIAWDNRSKKTGGQRWFDLHKDEPTTQNNPMHWTKRFSNWNHMCAECHSTQIKKKYSQKSNRFNTTWSEDNVGCQACHGPGSEHVSWAQKIKHKNIQNYGLVSNINSSHKLQVESCAQCHALRTTIRENYQHGKPFLDYYQPQLLTEPFYYPDGQIKEEDYIYGSFTQSKKFSRGVRCSDCHNVHSTKLKLKPQKLCISCHNNSKEKHFAGLKQKDYKSSKHHFHQLTSKGANCISCHMPSKVYMGIDLRHDHGFRIPRPDLSLKIGTPNACTQCHKNKSDAWAVRILKKWYPNSTKDRQQHFSEVFYHAQKGSGNFTADLIQVIRDVTQPEIIQSTALNLLSNYPNMDALLEFAQKVKDDSPIIRVQAAKGIGILITSNSEKMLLQQKASILSPLLNDPILAVRIEAAQALSDVPLSMLPPAVQRNFQSAVQEYIASQLVNADRPESHFNIALLHQKMKNYHLAKQAYEISLQLAPDYLPSYFNLTALYNQEGENKEAKSTLRRLLKNMPNNGEAHYLLALIMIELKQYHKAESELKKAISLLPNRQDVMRTYKLLSQRLN